LVKTKLVKRANKQSKKNDKISKPIELLLNEINVNILSSAYESQLSESFKNKEGIFYTSSMIVKDMLRNIKPNETSLFLDPCCGGGEYIIEAINAGINPENAYGYDTDANAVIITKKRIKELFEYDSENIIVGDFLEIGKTLNHKKFDFISTNPPWGKKLPKNIKLEYSNFYGTGKSDDSTSLFIAASLNLLKPNGQLGFLVQEAVFNIGTFEDIRKIILSYKLLEVYDYAKPFKGLLTRAQSFIIKNSNYQDDNLVECKYGKEIYFRKQSSFKKNPKSIINFFTKQNESDIIDYLFSLKHSTLKDKAHFGLGIVTGDNKRFCKDKPDDGYLPIYKGSDITKEGLKEPSTWIIDDFSNFQQVSNLEYYYTDKKILYKFSFKSRCNIC
jgi:site-specific DNA-methyltransferase (adenine-specific)